VTVRPLTATDPVPRCTCRLRNDSETFKLRREATRRVIEDAAHTGVVRRDRYHTKTSPRKCVTVLVPQPSTSMSRATSEEGSVAQWRHWRTLKQLRRWPPLAILVQR